MSALTPDEQAEFAALTRVLFARDATNDAAAQQRYAALEARRRTSAHVPSPPPASEPAAGVPASIAQAGHSAQAVVPALPHSAPASIPRPPLPSQAPVPEPRIAPPAPVAEPVVPSQAHAVTQEQDAEKYAAIPELGELMNAPEPIAVEVSLPVGGAIVESFSEKAAASASRPHPKRTSPYSVRTRVVSAALGLGIAALIAGVVGVIQWAVTPKPIASGTAVVIDVDQVPEMGSWSTDAIRAAAEDGATIFRVDGVPDTSLVVVQEAAGVSCAYMWPQENGRDDMFAQYCATEFAPIIWDYPLNFLHDDIRPESPADFEFIRIIVADGEFSIWESPPVDRGWF